MPYHLNAIQQLMQELGPQTSTVDAVVQHGEKTWAVQLDDDSIVLMEWGGEPERLVLSTDLGVPLEERRLDAYQLLLCYNLLWRESGGLKTALGGPEGSAMLLYEWSGEQATLMEMQTVLHNFSRVGAMWRSYIANGVGIEEVFPSLESQLLNARV
jgi:hypothetical protein